MVRYHHEHGKRPLRLKVLLSWFPTCLSNPAARNRVTPRNLLWQETNTDIYVKTQKEFTSRRANERLHQMRVPAASESAVAKRCCWPGRWATFQTAFSDDVTSESRVLIHRNIRELVNGIAPFPNLRQRSYIVVSSEGRLGCWTLY